MDSPLLPEREVEGVVQLEGNATFTAASPDGVHLFHVPAGQHSAV